MNESQIEKVLQNKIQLLDGVSPLYALPNVSSMIGKNVYVKNDSNISLVYGATKVRKLEYILCEALARGAKNLVTIGSWGSNHVLAMALYCQKLGLGFHAVVVPQPYLPSVERSLGCINSTNAHLYFVKREIFAPLKVWSLITEMKRENRAPYFVYLGGSNAFGSMGTVSAAFEFLGQVKLNLKQDSPIYLALGSGSSVAGLALGLALSGKKNPIKAIQVTSKTVMNQYVLDYQLNAAAKLLVGPSSIKSLVKLAKSLIHIDRRFLGKGYGWETMGGEKAIEIARLDDLELDPVYTAKVFAGLLSERDHWQEAVYWHTQSTPLLLSQQQLGLPSWYLDYKK